MIRILGVDPGGTGKSNDSWLGWACVDTPKFQSNEAAISKVGQIKAWDLHDWLENWIFDFPGLTHVVCEDYIQRPDMSEGKWTPQDIAKQIGAISYRCKQLKLHYFEFQPSDKPNGYRAAGLTYVKGKKGTHIFDATAHAMLLAKCGAPASKRKG